MIVSKILCVSAIGFGLLASQAVAKEPVQAGASSENRAGEAETGSGIVNSIDLAMNRIVISDVVYSYSPGKLIVRKGGQRASGATALQPNQVVHFVGPSRKSGSNQAAGRTITEIWIDEK